MPKDIKFDARLVDMPTSTIYVGEKSIECVKKDTNIQICKYNTSHTYKIKLQKIINF